MKKQKKYFNTALVAALATSSVAVVAPAAASATFNDVQEQHYFYDAVLDLQARGIVKGFEDGTFRPNAFVTRGQAAKMLAGALGLNTTNVTNPNFTDVPATHQYYGAIAALANAGIITGFEDDTFRPGAYVQRNHVAKMLAGAMGLTAGAQDVPFTDVRADYKEAVAALYTNGVTTGKTATTFDGAANVTRGQFAAFIARAEKTVAEQVVVDGDAVTFTMANYTATGVTIDGKHYTYDAAVQAIFTEANKDALAGAKMTVTVADGVITKVNAITFNKAGNAEAPVRFTADAVVDAVTINADYVALKDVMVTGDVVVTNRVVDAVEFDTVTIDGNLIVDEAKVGAVAALNDTFAKSTKKGPKIKMKKSKIRHLHVKRDNAAIESDAVITEMTVSTTITSIQVDGTVTKMNVQSVAVLTISGNASFAEVVLAAAVQLSLNITGVIEALTVQQPDAKITVATTVTVTKLVLPRGSKAEAIIVNFVEVAKQITTITEYKPVTGGGSGSSSSSDRDNNDKNDSPVDNVATESVAVQVEMSVLFESLSDLHAVVGGQTYDGVTYEMVPTTADTTNVKFTVSLPKGTKFELDDKFKFTVTYKNNKTETIVVYFLDGKWHVAPQRSIVTLVNSFDTVSGSQVFGAKSGEVMTVNYYLEDNTATLTWENGGKVVEGEYFKVEVISGNKQYYVAFKYRNGAWTLDHEFFAGLVNPQQGGNEPQEIVTNNVEFTFADTTTADATTIDLTTIEVVGIVTEAAVTTGDLASVNLGMLMITFNAPYFVKQTDKIEIRVIRPNNIEGELYTISYSYEDNRWVAVIK